MPIAFKNMLKMDLDMYMCMYMVKSVCTSVKNVPAQYCTMYLDQKLDHAF